MRSSMERFKPGEPIRVKVQHPHGHTRTPQYVRGRTGVIESFAGIRVNPESNAHPRRTTSAQKQPVYLVRFEAEEIWGPHGKTGDKIYLHIWENWLEKTNPV